MWGGEERPNSHQVMQSLLLLSSQESLTSREGLGLHSKCWWKSLDLAGPLFLLQLVVPTSAWLLAATWEHEVLLPHLRTWSAPAPLENMRCSCCVSRASCSLALQSKATSSRTIVSPDKDSACEHLLNQLLPPFLTLPQTDTTACFLGWHPRHTVPPAWGSVGRRYQRLVVEIGSKAFVAHLRGGKKGKSESRTARRVTVQVYCMQPSTLQPSLVL